MKLFEPLETRVQYYSLLNGVESYYVVTAILEDVTR